MALTPSIIADSPAVIAAAQAAVDNVLDTSDRIPKREDGNGFARAIADEDGTVAFGVRHSGEVVAPIINGTEVARIDSEYAWAKTDAFGAVALGIKKTGEVVAPTLTAGNRAAGPSYSTGVKSWDPRLGAYNLTPRCLMRWSAALARGLAILAALGDSRTRGALATGTSAPKWMTAWPGRLAELLGAVGTGIVPFFDETFDNAWTDPRWTWGTGVSSRTSYGGARKQWGYQGLSAAQLDNSGGQGWAQFASVVDVDEFRVHLISAPGNTGLATISVDGATVGTVSMAAVASGGTLSRLPGYATNQIVVSVPVSAGPHTIRVTGASGEVTNLAAIEGRMSEGIIVSNLGRSSTDFTDWVHDTGDGRGGMPWHIDAVRADLLVVMPISNDRTETPEWVTEQLRTVIARQRVHGDVLVLLPCMPDFDALGGTVEQWEAICGAIYALADELDFPIIDNTWAWVDFDTADALGQFGDSIHENDSGSRRISQGLAPVLKGY